MDYVKDAFNRFANEDFVCDDATMNDAITSVLDLDDDPFNFGFDPITPLAPSVYIAPKLPIAIGGRDGVPDKVIYFSQGRKKELSQEAADILTFKYNIDLVDFSFPSGNNTKQADNLMLGWRIGKRMKAMGYDDHLIDRVICVLGNRYCLGCTKKTKGGMNGDIIAGTMHCNQCAPHAIGTIDDHIDEFLAMDFNKWARNIKKG